MMTPKRFALWVVLAAFLGVLLGRAVPPPYPDGQWWATFVTSPGFGGAAALLAAGIAGSIAWRNAEKDRRLRQQTEQRSQWWDRFAWATEKSVDPTTSMVGLKVLDALVVPTLANEEDARMAIEVSEIIDPPRPSDSGKAVTADEQSV